MLILNMDLAHKNDILWMCLDGEGISVRILLFELVVENSMRLVISQKNMRIVLIFTISLVKYCLDRNLRIVER
jgi:hypothetical protein